jgi:hypothetical protein
LRRGRGCVFHGVHGGYTEVKIIFASFAGLKNGNYTFFEVVKADKIKDDAVRSDTTEYTEVAEWTQRVTEYGIFYHKTVLSSPLRLTFPVSVTPKRERTVYLTSAII